MLQINWIFKVSFLSLFFFECNKEENQEGIWKGGETISYHQLFLFWFDSLFNLAEPSINTHWQNE